MKHNPFVALAETCFVNGRGEFSTNLSTSRSKVAKAQRRQNKINRLKGELSLLLVQLRKRGRTETLARKIAFVQSQIQAC